MLKLQKSSLLEIIKDLPDDELEIQIYSSEALEEPDLELADYSITQLATSDKGLILYIDA